MLAVRCFLYRFSVPGWYIPDTVEIILDRPGWRMLWWINLESEPILIRHGRCTLLKDLWKYTLLRHE